MKPTMFDLIQNHFKGNFQKRFAIIHRSFKQISKIQQSQILHKYITVSVHITFIEACTPF